MTEKTERSMISCLKNYCSGKKEKGSLTIEAVISFTVFLAVSFLMLQLVKLTMVSLVLNSCTQETAKQLATSCYPIVIVNSGIDGVNKKLTDGNEITSSVSSILESSSADAGLLSVMGAGTGSVGSVSELFSQLADTVSKGINTLFTDLKGKAGLYITAKIMDGYLDSSGIAFNKDNVVFRIVKLPLTDGEYKYMDGYHVEGEKDDLVLKKSSDAEGMDGDFNRDDIVVCAEYDYQIVLPLIPSINLKLRSTAVEHAWLTGCSSSTSRKEGLREKVFKDEVYLATGGYGKSYHRKDCRMITLNGSFFRGSAINRSQAVSSGYEPCKVCQP